MFRMLESPTKRMTPAQKVRFDDDAKSVTPLKGVLKKPIQMRVYFTHIKLRHPF
jgi:hypothetical protein